MCWFVMSLGSERDIVNALFIKIFVNDYEKLCNIHVLGLKEGHYKYDEHVYKKFKKRLKRDEEGLYEIRLVWKEGNLPLGNNKNGSLGRLTGLVRNLK